MGAGDDFGATLRDRLHAEFDPMPVREEGMARHCVGVLDEATTGPYGAGIVSEGIVQWIRRASKGGPVASIDVERAEDEGGGPPFWSISFYCTPQAGA